MAALLWSYATTTRKVSRRTLGVVLDGEAVAHHAGAPAIPIAFLPIGPGRGYARPAGARRVRDRGEHTRQSRAVPTHGGASLCSTTTYCG